MKTDKNNLIQLFRGISICAVVVIHTTPDGMLQVLCRPLVNFCVATFLFLSGYLTRTENINWYSFYKKRLVRVIYPYFLWTVIYSLPSMLSGGGISILTNNLLTAHAACTLYYIPVYISFVLLTPLLTLLAKSKIRLIGWIVTPISLIIFTYYPLLSGTELSYYIQLFWDNSCLGWFFYYYLGLILGNRILSLNCSKNTLLLMYLISILLQMAEGYVLLQCGEINCGTQIKLTSFISSTIFLLIVYEILRGDENVNSNNDKYRVFNLLGDYSFGIYLCHMMIILVMKKIPLYSNILYPVTSVIVIMISWMYCYFFSKIFGKNISKILGLV